MKLPRLLAFGLFFLVLSISGKGAASQSAAPALAPMHSIQANFVQEKHLKILAQPIISTGTLVFQRPESLRWEYTRPIRSILLMHGGTIQKFVERDGHLVADEGMQFGSMQVILTEISRWLDGRFSDNTMFAVARPAAGRILLTPKNQELAQVISRIELTLADKEASLDEITIYEGPDSFTRMYFSNRMLNQEIPVTVFTRQ